MTHHQTGGYGVALHAGRAEWERRYGTQFELMEWIKAEIGGKNDSHEGMARQERPG